MHTESKLVRFPLQMPVRQIATAAQALIDLLDALGGDPDLEEDDPAEEDGCDQDAAWLERGDQSRPSLPAFADHWSELGDPEGAEEDDPPELNGDEGDYSDADCGHCPPRGIDQTKPIGPNNPEAA